MSKVLLKKLPLFICGLLVFSTVAPLAASFDDTSMCAACKKKKKHSEEQPVTPSGS